MTQKQRCEKWAIETMKELKDGRTVSLAIEWRKGQFNVRQACVLSYNSTVIFKTTGFGYDKESHALACVISHLWKDSTLYTFAGAGFDTVQRELTSRGVILSKLFEFPGKFNCYTIACLCVCPSEVFW